MIELNDRQERILDIVKKNAPITGEKIAELLGVNLPTKFRSMLCPYLSKSILTTNFTFKVAFSNFLCVCTWP